MHVSKHLELASDWLTKSEIIHGSSANSRYGPLKGGYLIDEKKYNFIYNEINGYGISCFVNLYRSTGNEEYLRHAKAVADYLFSTLSGEDGHVSTLAFVHSASFPEQKLNRRYFSFDNGMIVSGLLDLYEVTGDLKYYDHGKRCISWIIESLQQSDGAFHSYYNADTGEIWHGGEGFINDRSAIHTKLSIPLLKVWKHSGNAAFLNSANTLMKWAKGLQAEDGAFWSDEYKKTVFTHYHCYAVEGFLYAYHVTRNEEYRSAALRGIDWLWGAQLRDGSMNYKYKSRHSILDGLKDRLIKRKTSDATAQAVRLWLLADTITGENNYREAAAKGVRFLERMQLSNTDDKKTLGGLLYRRKQFMFIGRMQAKLYSWCTQFAAQAFTMWLQAESRSLCSESVENLF